MLCEMMHLVKGKRVCIEDVIKSMVGIESGLRQSGNHDASPQPACHYVRTLARHEQRNTHWPPSNTTEHHDALCYSVCSFLHSFMGLHMGP